MNPRYYARALALTLALAVCLPTTSLAQEAPPTDWVQLRTGERLTGDVSLSPSLRRAEFLHIGDRRFALHQVNTFEMDGERYGVAPVVARQQVLLSRTVEGPLSIFRETNNPYEGPQYMQKDDGPILIANRRHLRQAVADNPEAMAFIQHDVAYEMLGWVGMLSAAGLVGYGSLVQFDVIDGSGGVMFALGGVGLGVLIAATVPTAQRQARRSAIRTYNRP